MKVLVFGGTGTLGRQIARRALDAGHSVRCLVRSPRKAAFLQEWGCELTRGNLLDGDSLAFALEGQEAVIDAATTRASDSDSVYRIDWEGKLNLLKHCRRAGVDRFVFLSLLHAEAYPSVPLMDIKAATEEYLQDTGLAFTILRSSAFMQGLISQFAIPILESQTVWVSGQAAPIAYINTQDLAQFAVAALDRPDVVGRRFDVVGPRAWNTGEVVQRVQPVILQLMQGVCSFFEAGLNVSERLAFAEVGNDGRALDAPMDETYAAFGLDPAATTRLEDYLEEYTSGILKRLREMEADLDQNARKKLPF
jgi:uncharacterized protein YbjT (DUF2867 family)